MDLNQKLINKLRTIEVKGKGRKGDFFGKIDGAVCFIKQKEESVIDVGDFVDVKITKVTEKCIFSELVSHGKQ